MTVLFRYKNASKTDVTMTWLARPKLHQKKTVKTMEELYPMEEYSYKLHFA